MLAAFLLALATTQFEPVTPLTSAQTEQVFVHDASAPAVPDDAPGAHDPGLRPPRDTDSSAAQLFAARGNALGATLADWRAARGSVALSPTAGGGTRVQATFHNLMHSGRYSLFLRQLAGRSGPVLTPVDITGAGDSFFAGPDGNAQFQVDSPNAIPPGAQLVLIYHSDGVDHASSIGDPGVNAHAQLITRVP